jgi:putative peptide zinc metalloprotease protein
MESQVTHSTFQLASIVVTVRDDINVLFRDSHGARVAIIEDTLNSSYYRIGLAEYTFLSLLDGKTNFAAALGKTAAIMKDKTLTEEQAATFCQWLIQSGLAHTQHSRSIDRLNEAAERHQQHRARGAFSTISQRIPLGQPNDAVRFLDSIIGWIFSPVMFLPWLGLLTYSLSILFSNWQTFVTESQTLLSAELWLYGVLTWGLLKLVHEGAHAVACRRFGGHVREAGVLFILFVPLPYVDVTSAWRFQSKWQRIVTSAAGMMAEITCAAIAIILWSQTETGVLHQQAYSGIWIAGVATLLFNANPLMRFDGYYMLSDFLELPNLASHGQQCLKFHAKKLFLGLRPAAPDYPEGHHSLFFMYGVAAYIWRILICVGLCLAAGALFSGLGIIIAVVSCVLWFALPTLKVLQFIWFGNRFEQPSRIRFASILIVFGASAWFALTTIPWIGCERAPAVVAYRPRVELRSEVSGFVDVWFKRDGEIVAAGELLGVLRNEELQAQRLELAAQIEQSRQRSLEFLDQQSMAAYQVESEALVALQERAHNINEQLQGLEVRSPANGVLLLENRDMQPGMYISAGEPVAEVGVESSKSLIALINQDQYPRIVEQVGSAVRFHLDGQGFRWEQGTLEEINPRATRQIPHPAITALTGGPIPVDAQPQSQQHPENNQAEPSFKEQLLKPHFLVHITLPQSDLAPYSGQTATVLVNQSRTTLGDHLRTTLQGWWHESIQRVEQKWFSSSTVQRSIGNDG